MKAIRTGNVIVTPDIIRVEGWEVAREPSDNPNVESEQLLVELAVKWALDRLQAEVDRAKAEYIKRIVAEQYVEAKKNPSRGLN